VVAGAVRSDRVYEDDLVLAFHDIHPQAPIHILVVPKEHIATLNDLQPGHATVVGRLFLAARHIAEAHGFAVPGYRTVINCNELAGQSVFHLHLHVLAGRPMRWPPG
jgi:histidine triad (HIT) family protein